MSASTSSGHPVLAGALDIKWPFQVEPSPCRQIRGGRLVVSKTDKIRAAWAAGDQISALRIAARFFDRSDDTKTFKRAIAAHNNPDFYRPIGKDPEQITSSALELLARFGLRW